MTIFHSVFFDCIEIGIRIFFSELKTNSSGYSAYGDFFYDSSNQVKFIASIVFQRMEWSGGGLSMS